MNLRFDPLPVSEPAEAAPPRAADFGEGCKGRALAVAADRASAFAGAVLMLRVDVFTLTSIPAIGYAAAAAGPVAGTPHVR